MLVELLILIAIVLLLYQRWAKRDVYKLGKQLNSCVRTFPFIGHSYLFLGNNHTKMKAFQTLGRDAIKNENGLSSFWLGNYLYTMIANPEDAGLVLKTCLEKDDIMKMVTIFFGNGSIFAPVSIWRPRRKILNPSFSIKKLMNFMSIFEKHSAILVQEMGKMVGTDSFSAWKFFNAYTMDSTAESTLGCSIEAQKATDHPFLTAFEAGFQRLADRICRPWLHSDLVYKNLPDYSKQTKDAKIMWDFVSELITKKRREMKENKNSQEEFENSDLSDGSPNTFLESLIRSSGGDEGYTDVEILEELMVLMLAATDTSAAAASFTSVMLSRYPEVQEKVYKELQEVFGDSNRPITFGDLTRLKYLDAVIREALRLYPPGPLITRKVENDILLPSGIKLVPGTGVIVNIWALHRNPRYWGDDAELFRPERFIDTPLTHPAAFMPFSHGPRNCVGYQYGMMSTKTALLSVLRRYRILPATASNNDSEHPPLRLTFDILLKDQDKFQIRIEPRS